MSEVRSHFLMLPYLIDDLGLDVYQYRIYGAIKRAAGDDGVCTKSHLTLSKLTKISIRKIINVINELCQTHPILKKPLLTKKSRLTEHGDQDTDLITVTNIWGHNDKEFKKSMGHAHGAPPHAQDAPPHAQNAGGVMHMVHEGHAHGAPKEEPFKKNPFKKKPPPPTPKDPAAVATLRKFIEQCKSQDMPFGSDTLKQCGLLCMESLRAVILDFWKRTPAQRAKIDSPDAWLISTVKKKIKLKEI